MAIVNDVGNALTGSTGTGAFVGSNSPTLTGTPAIAAATGTSINLGGSTTINGFIDDDTFATASNTTGATSESIKAYVDAQSGGSVGLISNLLFNSTFLIAQRGSQFTAAGTYPNNDAVYLVDGWVNLSDGNDVVDVRCDLGGIDTGWGGNRYECLVATANKQFGAVQFVEALSTNSIAFQSSTFTAMICANLPGGAVTINNLRFAIIEWTGAVNAMTRDVIATWNAGATLPTLAANWAYVANHAEITLDSTFRSYKITGTTSASAKNIAFLWWCSDNDATLNDQMGIEGAWIFPGDITASLPADGTAINSASDNLLPITNIGLELRTAQRYFQKTFNQSTAPVSNAGFVGASTYTVYRAGANNNFILHRLTTTMRTTPTVASFNPGAAGTAWRNDSTTANSGAFATQYIGDSSVTLYSPGAAGDGLSQVVGVHLTLTAEL